MHSIAYQVIRFPVLHLNHLLGTDVVQGHLHCHSKHHARHIMEELGLSSFFPLPILACSVREWLVGVALAISTYDTYPGGGEDKGVE